MTQFSKTINSASIHTAGTVQSLFEEHEGELQHLPWLAQSSYLNIIEPLWSVLETRLRNRFTPLTSLEQLEDVLQEEWYKILLETVKTCTSPFQERLKAKGGPTPYVVHSLLLLHDINFSITEGHFYLSLVM
jgi:hypothetical protein